MKVFHTFETEDRSITLCADTKFVNTDYVTGIEVNIGWAILRPGDIEKKVTVDGKSRNYGEVLAQGRAVKRHKRFHNVAIISESIGHRAVIEAMLISFEHYMKKNLNEFIAAL